MRFTVGKRELASMLRMVGGKRAASKRVTGAREKYLRIEATGGRLALESSMVGVEMPAEVAQEGVCYLVFVRLLALVQSFAQNEITMEIDAAGLHIGNYHAGDGIWLALFDNPARAPRGFLTRADATESAADDAEVFIWRNFYNSRQY